MIQRLIAASTEEEPLEVPIVSKSLGSHNFRTGKRRAEISVTLGNV